MAKKLVGIADAKDLTTEEDVAKLTRNLEAVMLKNKLDNDPNVMFVSADSIDNYDPEDANRKIDARMDEIMAWLHENRQ